MPPLAGALEYRPERGDPYTLAILHDFVREHDVFSRSRLNAIIREADGDFWIARLGRVSRRPVLRLRGLGRVIEIILQRCHSR